MQTIHAATVAYEKGRVIARGRGPSSFMRRGVPESYRWKSAGAVANESRPRYEPVMRKNYADVSPRDAGAVVPELRDCAAAAAKCIGTRGPESPVNELRQAQPLPVTTAMTLHLTSGKSWITFLIAAAAATGCGGSAQTVSPLAPSSASVGTLFETGDTADVSGPAGGKGSGGGSGHHDDDDRDDEDGRGDRNDDGAAGNIPGAETRDVELHGIVAEAAGTCPARTFTVAGGSIATDASTIFEDGTCADLANGGRVEVKGVLRADGSLLATRVELDDDAVDDDDDDEDDDRGERRGPRETVSPLDGTVSNLVGACPTVVFQIKGVAVVATEATVFVGGTCQTLRPSAKVIVTGEPVASAFLSRPTLKASTIDITRAH